jgi:hypothetical protein
MQQLSQLVPPVSLLPDATLTIKGLSGHYADPGPTLRKNCPGALSGCDLYLFPDRDYMYVEWADIMPPTIFDKGKWSVRNGLLVLASDGSMPKHERPRDRLYLPITLPQNAGERMLLMGTGEVRAAPATFTPAEGTQRPVLLMGTEWNHTYFLENAGDDPLFMLLLCSLELKEVITESNASPLKAKLMKESWKPAWFEGG